MLKGLEELDCNTGNVHGMSFREVVLMMAKSHPEKLADTIEKIRNRLVKYNPCDKCISKDLVEKWIKIHRYGFCPHCGRELVK